MELRYGPYTYGWLQSRIFDNGRKPDRATPRAGRRVSACKLLFQRRNASDCTLGIRSCKLRATPIKIGRIRHFGRMARPPRVISERELQRKLEEKLGLYAGISRYNIGTISREVSAKWRMTPQRLVSLLRRMGAFKHP